MLKRYTKILVIGILAVWTIAEAGTWEEKSSMPTSRRAPAGVEAGGKIYVIGGCGGPRSNEEYNPATNSWAIKSSLPRSRRRGMGAVAGEVNEKVYFFGGHQGPPPGQTVNFNDEYDPATNSWTTKASMPTATEGAAAGVVDGKIYVIGGYSGTSFLDTLQEYDPGTDSWTTKALMPTARAFIAGAVVDGKIYVIGGYNGSCLNTVQEYNPEADSWTTKAPMPTARYWLAADVIDRKIYVVGGYDGSSYLTTNEVYDPATDSWSTETPMPTARSHLVAVEADGKIYAIGGVLPGGNFTGANEEFSPEVGIEEEHTAELPDAFCLNQNYPNPSASTTNIGYTLPTDCKVKLEVYNVLGEKITTLVNQPQNAGHYRIQWKTSVTSGIYFLRIDAGGFSKIQKMVIME